MNMIYQIIQKLIPYTMYQTINVIERMKAECTDTAVSEHISLR